MLSASTASRPWCTDDASTIPLGGVWREVVDDVALQSAVEWSRRHAGRGQGLVVDLALPRPARAGGSGAGLGGAAGRPLRARGALGPAVLRAAPADRRRQGQLAPRAGRRSRRRLLRRRRRRRPPRLRRARPARRARGARPCGWVCAARRWPASCSTAPTSWSTARRACSTCFSPCSLPADPRASRRGVRRPARRARDPRPPPPSAVVGRRVAARVASASAVPLTSKGWTRRTAPSSSAHAPASGLSSTRPSRSLTSAPSLATRFSPSRTGLTSSTS